MKSSFGSLYLVILITCAFPTYAQADDVPAAGFERYSLVSEFITGRTYFSSADDQVRTQVNVTIDINPTTREMVIRFPRNTDNRFESINELTITGTALRMQSGGNVEYALPATYAVTRASFSIRGYDKKMFFIYGMDRIYGSGMK